MKNIDVAKEHFQSAEIYLKVIDDEENMTLLTGDGVQAHAQMAMAHLRAAEFALSWSKTATDTGYPIDLRS